MDQLERPGQTDVVLLSDEDRVTSVVVNAVENLWEAVNELTRLQRTHKDHYFATIFGSARIQTGSPAYLQIKDLAAKLTEMGCGIITGGGPGLMQAANEGASVSGSVADQSVGIRIDLPFETAANPFVGRAYTHKTFFSRLHHFVIVSDVFIVVPGGIGTLLELSMVWQLLQVRKLYDTPLILLGDMWSDLISWAEKYMLAEDCQLAQPRDFDIPTCVKTTDEAIQIVKAHRERWLKTHTKSTQKPSV